MFFFDICFHFLVLFFDPLAQLGGFFFQFLSIFPSFFIFWRRVFFACLIVDELLREDLIEFLGTDKGLWT